MQDYWIEMAKAGDYKYIVACGDSFDMSYYPCYCKTKKEADRKASEIRRSSMQSVFEIYEVAQLIREYEREYKEDD
jgi:hypothetical protein